VTGPEAFLSNHLYHSNQKLYILANSGSLNQTIIKILQLSRKSTALYAMTRQHITMAYKIQKSMTLDPELVDWLTEGVEAGKFPHLSGGVEHAIRFLREYESPEATSRRREAEERLVDAEGRARKAEAAIDVVEEKFGVPLHKITEEMDEIFRELKSKSDLAAYTIDTLVTRNAELEERVAALEAAAK